MVAYVPREPRQDKTSKFWSKVQELGEDDCWEWQGALDWSGYGVYWFDIDGHYRARRPPRIVYHLEHGELADELIIKPSCSNSICCNPKHLNALTHAEAFPKKVKEAKIRKSAVIPIEEKIVKFWSKVNKEPGQGPKGTCWEWQGARSLSGYGNFNWKRKPTRISRAHRISFCLEAGIEELDSGILVLHSCDNPPCVNPEHLSLGDHDDNAQDAVERGRTRHVSREEGEDKRKKVVEDYRTGLYTKTDLLRKHKTTNSVVKRWLILAGLEEDRDHRYTKKVQ